MENELKHENILSNINTTIDVKRSEYMFNGHKVPRVTEILSFIDMGGLLGWANYIGLKHQKYSDVMAEASHIGTVTHSNIENYLQNKPIIADNIPYKAFLLWWDGLTKNNKVEIIGQEEQLSCEYFGGTYDMLITINGKYYLMDFKTSNHVGYKYFMQLAAYRYMIYKNKGISLNGCIVLQLNKNDISFQEYVLNFENEDEYNFIELCTQAFFSLVFTYYTTTKTQIEFENIFGKK